MIEHCKRGELYYADLGKGIGSEQAGFRPVLIVQNDVGNQHGATTIVAPVSSQITAKAVLPTHFYIGPDEGLERPSVVLLEQLRTISKKRLASRIGSLSNSNILAVNHCLAISIGLIQVPPRKLMVHLCRSCANKLFQSGSVSMVGKQSSNRKLCTYCNHSFGPAYEILLLSSVQNEESHK